MPELLVALAGTQSEEKIREFERQNEVWLYFVRVSLRHPTYYFFDVAIVINLLRWSKLLNEQRSL